MVLRGTTRYSVAPLLPAAPSQPMGPRADRAPKREGVRSADRTSQQQLVLIVTITANYGALWRLVERRRAEKERGQEVGGGGE